MLTPLGILLILIPLNYRIALGVVYNIDQLDYTSSSKLIVLLPQELTIDKSYDTEEAKITVLENETSSGNLILGGFYTPTNQVENTEDNDGVSHPGSVQYYKEALKQGGIRYSVNTTLHMLHVIIVLEDSGLTINPENTHC